MCHHISNAVYYALISQSMLSNKVVTTLHHLVLYSETLYSVNGVS